MVAAIEALLFFILLRGNDELLRQILHVGEKGREKAFGAQLEALEVIEGVAQITLLSLEKLSKCTIVPALRIKFLV